jgi:Protein of unknown function DUF262
MVETLPQELTAARYKVDDLLKLVREGRLRVPRFQRGLRWEVSDVSKLFDSIYRGFPIGTLLFWIKEAPAEVVQLGPVSISAPAFAEAYWVVDGQQRVTAFAASLLPTEHSGSHPRFEVTFDLSTEVFGPAKKVQADHVLPIREAFDLQRVLAWLRDRELPAIQQERAFRVADRLRNYEIPAYTVRASELQTLQTIFDRTNTFGKAMRKSEVFQALNSTQAGAKDDVETISQDVQSLGFGELTGNTLLYSMLSITGPDVNREFRTETDEAKRTAFEKIMPVLQTVIEFLRKDLGVPHFSLVPYQFQLIGLVRFFALHPCPTGNEKVLLGRWFWQAAEAGPISRLGSTGTLRATGAAITSNSAYDSVVALLKLTKGTGIPLKIDSYRWTGAETRISVCALANLGPIDATDGTVIDVCSAVEQFGRDALVQLFLAGSKSPSVCNRLFGPLAVSVGDDEYLEMVLNSDERVLRSLGLNIELVRFWKFGAFDDFYEGRKKLLTQIVQDFVDSRTERDLPVRPSISEVLADD